MNEDLKEEYFKKLNDNIEKHGYQLTYVSSENTPAFCYSTGIYRKFGIPELFISSLPRGLCSEIASNYIESFKNKTPVPIDTKLTFLIDNFPVYLIPVAAYTLEDYILSSINFYKNEDYKYLQIIYPDTNGYFPDEVGYNYDQEIMGAFISHP